MQIDGYGCSSPYSTLGHPLVYLVPEVPEKWERGRVGTCAAFNPTVPK